MLGDHLLGIYEKALDAGDDWYRRMDKVRELGFDFLEISIDESEERLSRIYGSDPEIMDIELMNCIRKHLSYEEKIGSPWYKVYPDVGNIAAWWLDPLSDLEAGIHSIVGVHLKDTLCRTSEKPGVFRDIPFGQGYVDFAACLGKLEELGYTGPYMIEMWHKEGQDDRMLVREAKAFIEEQYEKGVKR